jgi:hypothetical protein
MLRLYPSFRALEKEALKPLVSEASNHEGIVTRYDTGYKTPNETKLTGAPPPTLAR